MITKAANQYAPTVPPSSAKSALSSIDVAAIYKFAQDTGLLAIVIGLIKNLFNKTPKAPVTVPIAEVPVTPNVPTPIPTPPSSAPQGEPGRNIARVVLRVQKAEKPERVGGGPGELYDDVSGMVKRGEAFNYGAHLWLDFTAYDDEGDEWQGHSLIAADLEYRTKLNVYKNGTLVAFIHGGGGDEQKPNDWKQQISEDVSFGQRAWKDSIGFNTRTNFDGEGEYTAKGEVAGVESNEVAIRIS